MGFIFNVQKALFSGIESVYEQPYFSFNNMLSLLMPKHSKKYLENR
jgi:hypothetical protein